MRREGLRAHRPAKASPSRPHDDDICAKAKAQPKMPPGMYYTGQHSNPQSSDDILEILSLIVADRKNSHAFDSNENDPDQDSEMAADVQP